MGQLFHHPSELFERRVREREFIDQHLAALLWARRNRKKRSLAGRFALVLQ